MESQTLTMNQPVATPAVRRPSFALLALFRLALLVGPLTLAIVTMAHAPIVCGFACLLILSLWLSVDVGPFRASAPQPRKEKEAPVALPSHRNLAKAQRWNSLFCRAFVLLVLFHAKLNI